MDVRLATPVSKKFSYEEAAAIGVGIEVFMTLSLSHRKKKKKKGKVIFKLINEKRLLLWGSLMGFESHFQIRKYCQKPRTNGFLFSVVPAAWASMQSRFVPKTAAPSPQNFGGFRNMHMCFFINKRKLSFSFYVARHTLRI